MENLKKAFFAETKKHRVILISALAAFIGTFLPWVSISLGSVYRSFKGVSINGWHSVGYLTVLGSLAIMALWILPKVGVKYTIRIDQSLLHKILAIVVLSGPVLWVVSSNFVFEFIGYGAYISFAAGAVATYAAFVMKK